MASERPGSITYVKKAYHLALNFFKNYPALILPFFIFALLETLSLGIIYLAPRMPLRLIFAPIIRTFWGETFLHYPANFILLPKLLYLSRMMLSAVAGSILTGVAVTMALGAYHKKAQLKFKNAFKSALKQYRSFFIIVFIWIILFYVSNKIISWSVIRLFLSRPKWIPLISLFTNFTASVFLQAALVYAMPMVVSEDTNPIKAILVSLLLFKKLFISTLILVLPPMLIYIPIIVLESRAAFLINNVFPEFILILSFSAIIISSLIMDPLITIPTASLFMLYRDEVKKK